MQKIFHKTIVICLYKRLIS